MAARMDRIRQLEVFVTSVASGGVSAAARRLGLPPSSVSRTIKALEARVGVTLLARGPRLFRPTPEGEALYERARRLLGDLDELESDIGGRGQPAGTLRVSTSVAFGRMIVLPFLATFRARYPNVTVRVILTDRYADIAGGEADVALRVGPLADSDLVARKLGESPRIVVASPAYLAAKGTPHTPSDLARHECLRLARDRPDPWPFVENGSLLTVEPPCTIEVDEGESLAQLALAGHGIARLGRFHVRDAMERGELVELLAGNRVDAGDVFHAVYLGGRAAPERIRVFVELFAATLADREF